MSEQPSWLYTFNDIQLLWTYPLHRDIYFHKLLLLEFWFELHFSKYVCIDIVEEIKTFFESIITAQAAVRRINVVISRMLRNSYSEVRETQFWKKHFVHAKTLYQSSA